MTQCYTPLVSIVCININNKNDNRASYLASQLSHESIILILGIGSRHAQFKNNWYPFDTKKHENNYWTCIILTKKLCNKECMLASLSFTSLILKHNYYLKFFHFVKLLYLFTSINKIN